MKWGSSAGTFVLTFIFAFVFTFIFGVGISAQAESKHQKIFYYCAEAKPLAFNAQLASDGATYNASSRVIYNRLIGLEFGSTRVVGSLAESWKISPDGREFTFKLRPNIQFHKTAYFHPTRTLNSDDIKFTFDRMLDEKHPYHNVGGGHYPVFQGLQLQDVIEKVEKVDSLRVKFILKRPEAPFLADLAMDFANILSAEYGAKLLKEKKPELIDQLPIGTGPFVFHSYKKYSVITYWAHPDYFEGPARIDQLVFLITADPAERLRRLQTGKCHLIPEPAPDSYSVIKNDPHLKLLSQPGLNISYLAFNNDKMPFANKDIRLAIHHALHRELYVQEVFGGNAQVAKNPIPPLMWSYNRSTHDYEYNIIKAKKYLSKAGMENGFETELWYANVSRPYNPNPKKMAQLIQSDLAVVGIKVKLVELEWQDFLKKSRAGEPPMSIQGWTGDNGDPDNFLNNLLSCQSIASGNNRARWCNKRFSFLVDRARIASDIRVRTKFYEEAQQIFKEEVPWVTIAHATVFKAISNRVEGYRINPFGVNDFYRVNLK